MRRRRPDCTIRHRRAWASRSSTTTATDGPTSCLANDTQPNKLYLNKQQRHVQREGRVRRHRIQRRRRGARRHGRRCGRLRPLRPSQPDDHQFRQPDDVALSQRRQRSVRGRSSALGSRTHKVWSRSASDASSSTTTTTDGRTSSSPMDTSKTKSRRVQKRVKYAEPPHLFRNLGSGKFQKPQRAWARLCSPTSRPRRGLCRHRQRRRARSPGDHQRRARGSVPQRWRRQITACA